jgi:O-acetylhomoserine (thiol)-lyase
MTVLSLPARHLETLALHGGSFRADPTTGSVAPPIHLTTSFQFRDTEHARRLFGLEEVGYTYTRTINPSREVLERRLAALEGGVAALAVASGAAAILYALLSLAATGDNLVVSADLATGRNAGLLLTLRRFAIEVRLADPADPAAFVRASDDRTRAWFAESLGWPDLRPFPIADVAAQARVAGIPLLIENSATPLSLRPLALGAAVVTYSASEFIGGHGVAIGGIIIDGGGFDWEEAGARLPTLNTPDPSYHGIVWSQVVKQWKASPLIARARGGLLRDFGGAISPLVVFQLIQGLETLPLRIRHHVANAEQIAVRLAAHPKVSNLQGGIGGLIAFDLPSPTEAARFIDALVLFGRSSSFGDARSAVVLPALAPSRIVLSIGLEHLDDIEADLVQALARA